MKSFGFSPFASAPSVKQSPPDRVGVPGHKRYPQNWRILFQFTGSSFHKVLQSPLIYFYVVLVAIVVGVFSSAEYTPTLQGMNLPQRFFSPVSSLVTFMLTFFIGQVFSKANARFENVCKTNGNVTRLSALVSALLPQEQALLLMRYVNAIMHIYYLLLTGALDDMKWSVLQRRGLLTAEEIQALKLQGSPAVVLYSWAIQVLREEPMTGECSNTAEGVLNDLVRPMEEQFAGTRGLAAKQIAYTNYQIPSAYFHVVYFATNLYLCMNVYGTGHAIGLALSGPCVPGDEASSCVPQAVMCVVMQLLYLILFLGLLLTAESMCDICGDGVFHYDLGVDLDNLWQESQNVLNSMAVPCPSLTRKQTRL